MRRPRPLAPVLEAVDSFAQRTVEGIGRPRPIERARDPITTAPAAGETTIAQRPATTGAPRRRERPELARTGGAKPRATTATAGATRGEEQFKECPA